MTVPAEARPGSKLEFPSDPAQIRDKVTRLAGFNLDQFAKFLMVPNSPSRESITFYRTPLEDITYNGREYRVRRLEISDNGVLTAEVWGYRALSTFDGAIPGSPMLAYALYGINSQGRKVRVSAREDIDRKPTPAAQVELDGKFVLAPSRDWEEIVLAVGLG